MPTKKSAYSITMRDNQPMLGTEDAAENARLAKLQSAVTWSNYTPKQQTLAPAQPTSLFISFNDGKTSFKSHSGNLTFTVRPHESRSLSTEHIYNDTFERLKHHLTMK